MTFWSRQMTSAEGNYGTSQLELLAVMMSYKQWRHYLEDEKNLIKLFTDHANFVIFMTAKALVLGVQRVLCFSRPRYLHG